MRIFYGGNLRQDLVGLSHTICAIREKDQTVCNGRRCQVVYGPIASKAFVAQVYGARIPALSAIPGEASRWRFCFKAEGIIFLHHNVFGNFREDASTGKHTRKLQTLRRSVVQTVNLKRRKGYKKLIAVINRVEYAWAVIIHVTFLTTSKNGVLRIAGPARFVVGFVY